MARPTRFPHQSQRKPGLQSRMHPEPETIRQNYHGSEKLKGKVGLITGGDSGIGRAVAVHFAREGADVVIVYRHSDTDALETQRLVESEGQECLLAKGDAGNENFCKRTIAQIIKKFGQLDILVNNASVEYAEEDIRELDLKELVETFKSNVFSYFLMSKYAVAHLKPGSSIINTTSVNAYRGNKELLSYSASKGAELAFTRALASNLIKSKIRVNGVAPGPIWTPFIVSDSSPHEVATFGQHAPMGRAGQPSEVAPAYVFLASEDASYITGQVIHPNGGNIVNT